MTQPLRPFHLAIPVDDLAAASRFYGKTLGCPQGRSAAEWIDYDFFGHQLVVHLCLPFPAGEPAQAGMPFPAGEPAQAGGDTGTNPVDGHDVPVPHFGVVLTIPAFTALADRLRAANAAFVIAPTLRFAGQSGEQWTMFLRDPAGNALEFKAFADDAQLFAT
jgi:uncharacterized protein